MQPKIHECQALRGRPIIPPIGFQGGWEADTGSDQEALKGTVPHMSGMEAGKTRREALARLLCEMILRLCPIPGKMSSL